MLLRLVPPAPLPTILFTLTFPTLPQSLPLPPAWDAHLQLLADTQLASPPSLYALDKSVAWTALLDNVTFDLSTLTVTCIFIDGMREEWPLTNRCVDLLENVISDVNRSALEAENERDREPTSPPSSSEDRESSSEDPSPAPLPQKMSKAKKRRSLLAALMASLVPSSSSAPPPALPVPAPTPPPALPAPAALPLPPPPPLPEDCAGMPPSRFLRRRARSTLVDAFRRFVLTALSRPAPHYALWAARSTMRRAAEEMACVIEGALRHEARERERERDEDDSTTDGSSVHTPLDAHTPTPSPTPLAPEAYHAYIALKTLHHRLHDLVGRLTAPAPAAHDDAGVLLEIRSRRRAWSSRSYLREGASGALVGLAVPVRSSPLCCGWTPEEEGRGVRGRARSEGVWKWEGRGVGGCCEEEEEEAEGEEEEFPPFVGHKEFPCFAGHKEEFPRFAGHEEFPPFPGPKSEEFPRFAGHEPEDELEFPRFPRPKSPPPWAHIPLPPDAALPVPPV